MKASTKGFILIGLFGLILLGLVQAGIVTFRGDTVSFQNPGGIDGLENITLRDTPLMITDADTNSFIALFNAPIGIAVPMAINMSDSLEFPNTSTTHFGDVNNIDNINATSRFSETNINDGINAAAGFTGVNNVGNAFFLAIGSSNFEFFGDQFPNEVSLFVASPGSMNFVNTHLAGWEWKSNLDNSSMSFDFVSPMELSGHGSLTILGNFTGNQFYGYAKMKNESGVLIDLITVGVFENITGINNGSKLNGISYDGDHIFTINVNGTYEVSASVSFVGSSATDYHFDIFVNGIAQDIFSVRQITTPNAEGSISLGPYPLELNEGDFVTLGVSDGAVPTDPTIISVQFGLLRIGS